MEKEENVKLKNLKKEKNNFLGILLMSKPGKVLKTLCKKLGVRLTVKRGKKRVYKSVAVLKRQCVNKKKGKKKKKKKKVVKRRAKFGTQGALDSYYTSQMILNRSANKAKKNLEKGVESKMLLMANMTLPEEINQSIRQRPVLSTPFWNSVKVQRMRLRGERVVAPFFNLKGVNLQRADLQDANLRGANLRRTWLMKTDLRRANLKGANLFRSVLQSAKLQGANLERADLRHIYSRFADLGGANLRGANLEGANLKNAILQGSDLEGANLEGANLTNAKLTLVSSGKIRGLPREMPHYYTIHSGYIIGPGVDLEGANLQGADLRFANLRHAYLREADLRGANLKGADLHGADLYDAKLQGVTYNDRTQFPVGFNKRNPFHFLNYSRYFGKKKRKKKRKKRKK